MKMGNNLEKKLRKETLEINEGGEIKEFFIKSVLTIKRMLPENQKMHIGRTSADYDVIASTIGKQKASWPSAPIKLVLYNEDQSFYRNTKEVRYNMAGDVSPSLRLYKGFNPEIPLIVVEELMSIKSKKFPLAEIYLNNQNFKKYTVNEITRDLYGAFCYCNHMINEFKEKKIEEKMRKDIKIFFENAQLPDNLKVKD